VAAPTCCWRWINDQQEWLTQLREDGKRDAKIASPPSASPDTCRSAWQRDTDAAMTALKPLIQLIGNASRYQR
jgi:hypothetical protein